MKTFNEFINEGQRFLRSISKNDKIEGVGKTFGELKQDDFIYIVFEEHLCAQRLWLDLNYYQVIKIRWPWIHEEIGGDAQLRELSDFNKWTTESGVELYTSFEPAYTSLPDYWIEVTLNHIDRGSTMPVEEFKKFYLKK